MDEAQKRRLQELASEAVKNADPATKSSLAQVIFSIARGFNETSIAARKEFLSTKNAGLFCPYVVNRAFAAELLLKFFIAVDYPEKSYSELKDMGFELHGHPYSQLFDRIARRHQDALAEEFSRRSGSNTNAVRFRERLIELGDKPFVTWRYAFEPGDLFFDEQLFTTVVDSIARVATKARADALGKT